MSNDNFQSLLSTFQSATGGSRQVNESQQAEIASMTLLDLTTKCWRLSQLQQSTRNLERSSPVTTSAPTATPTTTTTTTLFHANEPPTRKRLHIAVCLCIVDDLPHESIWRYWMQPSRDSPVTAELYLHAKHPDRIRGQWARSKLLSVSHHPNWNDVRIVQAMLSLIQQALKDVRTTHIVFGTESCIPICPLNEIHLSPGTSYVAWFGRDQASRFDERNCWDPVQPFVPAEAIHKALPGWCVLCRSHAQDIIDLPNLHLGGKELWLAFQDCWAPEEVFFPTALALLGHLSDGSVVSKSLTYAEWNERAKDHKERAHPKCWDDYFDARLVRDVRHEHGCLFLRKIKKYMSVQRWQRAVMGTSVGGKRRHEYSDHDRPRAHNRQTR